jgi:hypothetical protein
MTQKPDGGPAFPLTRESSFNKNYEGMTLRDWFAGQADVPWNAVLETLELRGEKNPTVQRMAEYRAEIKYVMADAMIAAREAGR